jgi:hypothetical protein
MHEFRTRSLLLSIADATAGLIAELQGALRLGHDLDASSFEQGELARYGVAAPLAALLLALKDEAALSAFGAVATRWDIAQRIANLRRFHEEEERDPSVLDEPITAPMIITGLPRSGTTFLQNLLAADPGNRALRCWEVIYPYPDPHRPGPADARPQRFERQIRCFNLLTPDLHKLHPLSGWSAQECTEVTALVFQSLRFDSTYYVPSYRKWLDQHGHLAAYEFHKRFLQHLQHQTGRRRWVLKSPDHALALDALRQVYPDARIVFLHRDPMKVLPSNAQLIEMLRAPFAKEIDPLQIGRQGMADQALGARNMVDAARLDGFDAVPIFHLHFLDLIARPVEAVERLYRHFGIRLTPSATEAISRAATAKPNGGYAKNVYHPDRHGIDADEVEEHFRDYMDYFDIRREWKAPPTARARRYVPATAEPTISASASS